MSSFGENSSSSNNNDYEGHANLHIPSFLALESQDDDNSPIQVITDGKQLSAENILKHGISLTQPILVKDTPESIGMKVIKYPRRQVKVSDISAILGGAHPVDVIDVEHQDELDGWTLGDLVDYFEDPYREKSGLVTTVVDKKIEEESTTTADCNDGNPAAKRKQRRAAVKALEKKANQRPRVLNQISLEFSNTPLRQKINSPQFVRDLDWIDNAWPGRKNKQSKNTQEARSYPMVQYYCLTSAAGSYTDFHVDFGGTSVWYHVLSGQKEFCLIAPTKENLQIFEEWNCNVNQATTFLPNLIKDPSTILRITLQPSQTMIIPSAWIHGVYTPTDSIVLGGNFLHGLDMQKQLEIYDIEERTRVKERFRCPLYKQLHFYAAGMYLDKLRRGDISQLEVNGCIHLYETLQTWWEEFQDEVPETLGSSPNVVAAAREVAEQNNCMNVDHFLFEFNQEYIRVKQYGICPNEKMSKDASLREPIVDRPKLKLKLKANENLMVKPEEPVQSQSTVPNVVQAAVTSQSTSTEPKKIRLKLKPDPVSQPPVGQEVSDPFRIVVSSSSIPPTKVAPKPKAKRLREDTEWFDEGPLEPEDEWVPSTSTGNKQNKRSSKKKAKGLPSNKGKQGKQGTKSTARSRLMQRLR